MEPVAIVGLSCRFPGAPDPERYWELLAQGREAIGEMPEDRLALWLALGQTRASAPRAGYLDTIDAFEPEFFGLSPREAARMDPQQRLLLELAWEALEDAGVVPGALAETNVGVYVGVMNADHALVHGRSLPLMDAHLGIGSSLGIAANRVSYVLDLRGPSLAVDTLCSSSLVAVDLACQALRSDPSMPLALAGGVNVMSFPAMHLFYADAGLLSPDGRCRAFDAAANGIVRGEGGGLVALKRLADARRDGDLVYCVIRGSAVNQDGKSNGLTAPNRFAQERVLGEAYRRAGVSPADVQFVEAHGTGTLIGDPIELRALAAVLGRGRSRESRCAVSSVKTNLGHLESAAGAAALIKTALSLQRRRLCPSLNFATPNPYVRWADLPLRVVTAAEPWPEGPGLPLAGVSSFGLGGTNAHLVLEGVAPEAPRVREARPEGYQLRLSARTPESLTGLAESFRDRLLREDADVEGIVDTARHARTQHALRLSVTAADATALAAGLDGFVSGLPMPSVDTGGPADSVARPATLARARVPTYPFHRRPLHTDVLAHVRESASAPKQDLVYDVVWSRSDPAPAAPEAPHVVIDVSTRAASDGGYDEVLAIAKTLDAAGPADRRRLWVVTRGAQAVRPGETGVPGSAPVIGLARVIQVEHPELWGGLIDLDPDAGPEADAAALRATLGAPSETEVAWRDGVRYVPRLVPRAAGAFRSLTLRADATYLVTGGFGGLGLATASWLAERGARHLALVGRRGRTPESEPTLAALRARGVTVRAWAADVAEADAVATLLSELDASMPPLAGIFHSAGLVDDKPLYLQDAAGFEAVFAAKGRGALHLHRLTEGRALDYFVLYSSIAAVLGSPGQASYAAANAFLDALARQRAAQGRVATSVQWGPWASVGMAARDGASVLARGLRPLPPAEALDALERVLSAAAPTALVAAVDWTRLFAANAVAGSLPLLAGLRPRGGTRPAPVGLGPGPLRRETLVPFLRESLAAILDLPISDVPHDVILDRLGIDSLLGLELQRRIETALGRSVEVTSLFETTVEALAARLLAIPAAAPAVAPRDTAPGSWLVPIHLDPNARLRLFCFAYAGGSARVYRGWNRGLGEGVEVHAVELPGRGARRSEPLMTRIPQIVDALVPALLPYLDRPFAFFGHCLGSIVMFETARRLARDHGLTARELFASGAPSPPLYRIPQVYGRSDERFREVLALIRFESSEPLLRDPALLARALPSVRADFEAAAAYVFEAGDDGVLDAPITAFGAWEDLFAPQAALEPWRERTRGPFALFMRPGEHYFVETERPFLHDVIARRLAGPVAVAGLGASVEARAPVPRTEATRRLFCFPHLGSEPDAFDAWAPTLPEHVELVTLVGPAAGPRRVDELAAQCAAVLGSRLDRPFAFFGHDLGALLSFETAHALAAAGQPMPERLFVSSAMAPHLNFLPPVHVFDDERLRDLVGFFEIATGAKGLAGLRRDLELVVTYNGAGRRPLPVPITAFGAWEDTLVPYSGVEAWREHTSAGFELLRREGGHDSWRREDAGRALLAALLERLRDATA